jgi:hypothetical protein
MPAITEAECIAKGGQVITRPGPPTWHGRSLKICIIPDAVAAGMKLPWQKGGKRAIIIGKA